MIQSNVSSDLFTRDSTPQFEAALLCLERDEFPAPGLVTFGVGGLLLNALNRSSEFLQASDSVPFHREWVIDHRARPLMKTDILELARRAVTYFVNCEYTTVETLDRAIVFGFKGDHLYAGRAWLYQLLSEVGIISLEPRRWGLQASMGPVGSKIAAVIEAAQQSERAEERSQRVMEIREGEGAFPRSS